MKYDVTLTLSFKAVLTVQADSEQSAREITKIAPLLLNEDFLDDRHELIDVESRRLRIIDVECH